MDQAGAPPNEPFATAMLQYGEATSWLASWIPMTRLIQSRIQDLERLADSGQASRLSNSMAYQLFANSLVDYAAPYRGMHSVVLYGLEAFADVTLATAQDTTTTSSDEEADAHGTFTVPPHFIDSVAHLAGFIMNVSEKLDTAAKFAVTPGWRSMRFAKPLVAGGRYRSYVEMIPTKEDPSVYFGDVYILREGAEVMGVVSGIQFRRYPRILLSRFFSAPDDSRAPPIAHGASGLALVKKASAPIIGPASSISAPKVVVQTPAPEVKMAAVTPVLDQAAPPPPPAGDDVTSTTGKAIQIIASEAALDLADLTDSASFNELGVDSLMSLVIAEKFREQIGVVVNGSLFLEYPTVGDLRSWLNEYYS